jgi:hypothetical protein
MQGGAGQVCRLEGRTLPALRNLEHRARCKAGDPVGVVCSPRLIENTTPTNLEDGMRGGIRILALILSIGLVGCGDDESTNTGDVRPPAHVADLDAAAATDTTVTLTWTAPGDDGADGTASEYDVRYSAVPDSATDWWDSLTVAVTELAPPKTAGQRESLTVAPLDAETDYYFALRTADEVPNWSELSNVVHRSTTETPDRTPPAAVTDLEVESVTDSSVVLTWTAPGDDDDQGTADSYDLRYATVSISEEDWETASQVEGEPDPKPAGEKETFEVVGLTAGTVYWFALRTSDEVVNTSALSNTVLAKPDAIPPGAVTDLRVAGESNTTITLTWTAPGNDGNEGIASAYDLRYATDQVTEETWATANIVQDPLTPGSPGTQETMEVAGLLSRTTYYFALKTADDALNWSALSNPCNGTTTSPDARLFVVHPDSSGDYATIQEAIEEATDGDIIELGSGVFAGFGNRQLAYRGKAITIRSQSRDPEDCVIDCEMETRGISFVDGEGPGSVLEGVTIYRGFASDTHGQTGDGGGILCDGTSPRVIRCILSENRAATWGGGVCCSPTGAGEDPSHPVFTECTFTGNVCDQWGGGAACLGARSPRFERCSFIGNFAESAGGMMCVGTLAVFEDCVFRENLADESGGGFWCSADRVRLEGCQFIGNFGSAYGGGGIITYDSSTEILNCTFVLNGAPSGGGLDIFRADPHITNTIIAYSIEGEAINANSDFEPLVCCDLFGNMAGDWTGDLAPQEFINNNSSVDPLFCDPELGNFGLQPTSPCASENNPHCGLIGALPVACGFNER